MDERVARGVFAATSALVTSGLVLQLVLSVTADAEAGSFVTTPARVVNFLSFFTVQSNILVAVTCAMLARDLHRSSPLFRVLRLDAVLCIVVTGVVFHLALASLQELTGWDLLADTILHTISPLLAMTGWLLIGPRGALDGRIVSLAVVAPMAWLGYALARGALVEDRFGNDYYAYPFMNAQVHGYATALLRCALVVGLFLGLSYGTLAVDRRLGGVRS